MKYTWLLDEEFEDMRSSEETVERIDRYEWKVAI
jgi:hypothetical protein